jgi:regulatory protein
VLTDEADYERCLQKLAAAKLATLQNEKNIFAKKTKLQNYLLQKGFESSRVVPIVSAIGVND